MKKDIQVLLVSAYPFSHSSRGMDVLTTAFEREGWITSHLTFPRVFYTPDIRPPVDSWVNCMVSELSWLPYVDRFMRWFPSRLFHMVRRLNTKTVRHAVDWSVYDLVVLESGKPLMLLPEIPAAIPVAYRQSDSVRLVLGRGVEYVALEDDVFRRAIRIILKKSLYIDFIPEEYRGKSVTVENGMALPEPGDKTTPFEPGYRNVVYVGLHPLESETLRMLLERYPEIHFHVAGPCLRKTSIRKLRRFSNFKYYDYLSKEDYMPMLEHADAAMFPFVRTETMKWFGLTSKFLHFMYYRLPVVSFPTGLPGEFDDLPVYFAEDRQEFVELIGSAINQKPVIYPLDFDYYGPDQRLNAYREIVRDMETEL